MKKHIDALLAGEHHNPFELLSWHQEGKKHVLRIFRPDATAVSISNLENGECHTLQKIHKAGLFEGLFDKEFQYRVNVDYGTSLRQSYLDPYAFVESLFGEQDLYLFGEGSDFEVYRKLGAVPRILCGVNGFNFSVWAPNARRVSVVGDFNNWDGRIHQMRCLGVSGIWELFIPEIQQGANYKFEIKTQQGIFLKADPYGRFFELRPKTATRTWNVSYQWQDNSWMENRRSRLPFREPVSIYEVHPGSWQRKEDGSFLNYRELAERLVEYVKWLGFNYIELMPVSEHPLDESWGYQTTGFYAPTSRYGSPDDFRFFVDYCHRNGIAVILDWTPAHFPKDDFALYYFDGTHLYEHADPRLGEHPDWRSAIFNYGRCEVSGFLYGSALNWLENFHADGLRVDAVASMLYLDYSRREGEWLPNRYGGRENLEAIEFLRKLNTACYGRNPGIMTAAEESTAWPGVSKPVHEGGLGFGFKWNLGWMHDSLSFFSHDPVYRKHHINQLTFSLLYAFSENYILPLSHDEVVHGKGSLLGKMPGDFWQKRANLRLLFGWQFGHPGKKLLFMGGEFGQWDEWDCAGTLSWGLLKHEEYRAIARLVKDLNALYQKEKALYENDRSYKTFQWIDFSDVDSSVISFIRWDEKKNRFLVFVFNFTPVVRSSYRIGVPRPGIYREILNSDSAYYGGSNTGNLGLLKSTGQSAHGLPDSVELTLPPLGFLVFSPVDR